MDQTFHHWFLTSSVAHLINLFVRSSDYKKNLFKGYVFSLLMFRKWHRYPLKMFFLIVRTPDKIVYRMSHRRSEKLVTKRLAYLIKKLYVWFKLLSNSLRSLLKVSENIPTLFENINNLKKRRRKPFAYEVPKQKISYFLIYGSNFETKWKNTFEIFHH